jgi:uncharacterized protein YdaU (DUF1376 family)
MAPQKSPAFQFYAKDFQTGTASMSLQEVGAYIRLLAYQWDTGSVPSDARERARVLGCAKAQEADLWKKVGKKFTLREDVYVNERLETERQKQTEYRRRQSDKGRASAATRNQPSLNRASTEPQPALVPEGQPKGNSPVSGLQSSLKTTHTERVRVTGQSNGANAPGSLPRDHRFHPVCGARLRVCLSEKTAADLVSDWGGDPADALVVLQRFCNELENEIGDGPKGNHLWLLGHFDAFKARNGRVPVAAPRAAKGNGADVTAAIDAWGNDD